MTVQTLSDVFARASYCRRNPSRLEYLHGSPADQRAIVERWHEIAGGDDQQAATARVNLCLLRGDENRLIPRLEIDQKQERSEHHVQTGALVNGEPETISLTNQVGE